MANETLEMLWNTYSEAWSEITTKERKQLLTRGVTSDCYFADPNTELRGLAAFTRHIEEFQKLYPGAYFETLKFSEHHGQSVAEWMMHGKNGSELLPGISVARYANGKMSHVAGFWKLDFRQL
jgi:hypothetical protein